MKKLLITLLATLLITSCGTHTENPKKNNISENENIKITTSIIPLASLTNNIWWDFIETNNIVWAWKSPHNFDLKSSDLVNLEKSKWIIMIGLEHIDGFLDKNLEGKNTLKVSNWIKLLEMWEDEHDHENEEEHHKEEHEHESDPHIWNWAENIKIIAKKISDFLSKISPENSKIFEKNYNNFILKIENLVENFSKNTKWKEQQYFIVFHNAYNYLFKDLWIEENKKLVFRTSVLNDPNSNDMKKFIDEIQEHNVKIAFTEPQFSSTNFEKLAKEYGIKIYTLDPLWQDTSKNWYLKNLENNLSNLEKIFK